MIPGDPRYDPAARRKKIADLKVKTPKTSIRRLNQNLAFAKVVKGTLWLIRGIVSDARMQKAVKQLLIDAYGI